MTITTTLDLLNQLNVSPTQLQMAIYSGRLPKPNPEGYWEQDLTIYINLWKKSLDKKVTNKNYESGNCVFPRHTR